MAGALDVGRSGERGDADEVDRIDLDALAERWGLSLAPMWIREATSPGVDGSTVWPAPAAVEDLGDGSHLSYAVQWFIFTLIGLGGYPLVLVRLARQDPGVA
jgi:cytochrome oxidase assembly protein ShyY1